MRKNEIVYSLSGLLNSLSPIEIDDTKKLIAVGVRFRNAGARS